MEHTDLAQVAAVAGVVGSILILLARSRIVLLGGFAFHAAAGIGLSASLVETSVLDKVSLQLAVGAGIAMVMVLVPGTYLLVRWPAAIIPLVVAAAPFRPPVAFGSENRFLVAIATDGRIGRLLPLYAVLGIATLATVARVLRAGRVEPLASEVAYPAAVFTGLIGASLLWTYDLEAGTNLLLFFVLPSTLLLAVVGRAPVRDWLSRSLFVIVVGITGVIAAIGLWQAHTRELFFSTPRVEVGNVYADFFRVTSLFNDPSLYGRHLVVGISVVLVAMFARRLNVVVAAVLVGLLWAGLYFSYSQSSMVALLVTVVAIALVMGDRPTRTIVLIATCLIALVGATSVAASAKNQSIGRITSDRSRRVELTAEVFWRHPVVGVGIGGHPAATAALAERPRREADYVSHTTPLTIAAELGVVGLLAYIALLAGAIMMIDRVRSIDEALGVGLGAVFLSLFVHSLFYGGFFEDPMVWIVLGVGSAVLVAARRAAPSPNPTAAT